MHLILDSTIERKMTPLQLSEKPLPWAHVNFFRPVNLTIPSFPLKVALCQKNHNVLHVSFQGDSGGGIVVVDSKSKPQTYMLLAVLSQNRLGKHKSNLKNFHFICFLQNTPTSF